MLNQNEIGARIAVARKLQNLSQSQLAERLALSAQAVGKWERGESAPDILTFVRLAEILGTDVNYFAGMETAQPPAPAISGDTDEEEKPGHIGWNMSGSNWADADFSGLSGLAQRFSGSNIDKCQFVGSDLAGLTLRNNNIQKSDFSRSSLRRCNFRTTNLQHTVFSGCDFTGGEWNKTNLDSCDLTGADLTDVHAKMCNMKKLDLTGTRLCRTGFSMGQLTDITFGGVLTECAFNSCDFSRVTFSGAELINCFFKNAKLKRANFVDCKADRLTYAFLKNNKADLSDVTIIGDDDAQSAQ